MQKKIIALAVAAALTAPALAFADNSNVTVYGLLNADLESVRTNATVPAAAKSSATRVASNASRFGVKGSEDLGDGLKGIWQLEVQVDLNGQGGNGFGNGTRNSGVGLEGGFGKAILGNWDTPYKVTHNKLELFDNTTFATSLNVLGRIHTSTTANMNTRLKNSVQYWTPDLSGFKAAVAYGADNSVAAAGTQSVVSLSGTYENDVFYGSYGYQKFNDANLVTTGAKTLNNSANGNRVVGAYKFDQGLVGLTYERLSNTVAGAASQNRAAWELAGKYTIGLSNIGASYVKAGNLGGVANTGARQVSLRYGYNFSKRTEAYAMYSSLKNDTAAKYDFSNGVGAINGNANASLSGFGAGLIHTF